MTQSSYPFENIDTTETQFSQFFRNLGAGVVGSPSGTELKVTAGTGLAVSVALGQAMVRGHFYNSTAAETIALTAANGSNPRIDAIVLTLDPTANSIVLAKVDGTPAASPVAPTLTQTDAGVYQYLLATVLVPAAATVPSTITDSRGFLGSRFGVWTTATRPATSSGVQAGFNSTTGLAEFWNGSAWSSFLPAAGTITNTMLANSAITVNGSATSLGGSVVLPTNRNAIINGGFDFWQRGTSFTAPNNVYTSDRWIVNNANSGDSFSQQTFTPGTAPVAGYEGQFYGRMTMGAVAGTRYFYQKVEDVRTFAGQTVTFSFWAKISTGTGTLWSVIGNQNFGSGGSAFVAGSSQANTLTTSWQRFTYTATIPSVAGKTIGTGSNLEAAFNHTIVNASVDIWGVQLEAGSVATPFARNASSLQGEFETCRAYTVNYTNTGSGELINSAGGQVSTTQVDVVFYVPGNRPVTSIETANMGIYKHGGPVYSGGTWSLVANGIGLIALRYTHGSAVFTVGQTCSVVTSAANGYMRLVREL